MTSARRPCTASRAAEARQAPTSETIADGLIDRIIGRILVAHDWAFEVASRVVV
ncbi:hypothetical protein [Streptomyces dysideae]|uniref:hypothetical protein n=1 Tax=Streptomyces dysideae TaxID=909626 RepID=UPI00131B2CCB|nr:hypothetical protein [Streptomyces dysideae]